MTKFPGLADGGKVRNGYYLLDSGIYVPRVTTLLSCIGDPFGLMRWGAMTGAEAVICALAKIEDISALAQRLAAGPAALEWARAVGTRAIMSINSDTADFGRAVHALVEAALTGREVDLAKQRPDDIPHSAVADPVIALLRNAGVLVKSTELPVVGQTPHGYYAGRVDFIVELDEVGVLALRPYVEGDAGTLLPGTYYCDLKTGTYRQNSVLAQLSAYNHAQNGGDSGAGGLCIHAPRRSPGEVSLHVYSSEQLDAAYHQFFVPAHGIWAHYEDHPKWFLQQTK